MFASKDALFAKSSGSYQIARSLRFRSSASAYLSRTPASAGNRTTWTWSAWVKRGAISVTNGAILFGAYDNASGTDATYATIGFAQSDTLSVGAWSQNWRTTTQVFRDPSAFYHIVVAMDTTQTANADSRVRVFINGVEIAASAFGTKINPTASQQLGINSVELHTLGRVNYLTGTGPYPFDGYMAEVNFIDGYPTVGGTTYNATTWAALNVATLFGAFDTNGVWQPARYTGSYGTNGFYLPFSTTATSSYAASFNGSTQYLTTATNAGLGLGTSDFTVEYWMNSSATTGSLIPLTAGNGTTTYDSLFGYITASTMVLYMSSTGSSWDIASGRTIISSLAASTWYHIAITRSGSTFKTFVNGVQVDTFTSSASIYQSANQFTIARAQSAQYFNGSLSNVRVVKGTALYTSNFTPSAQPLTAVTNTQLLTLQGATIVDNSSNALSITNTGTVTTSAATPWSNFIAGQDSSGLGNGWASANVNVTSSGTTYDSMIDSPTNYADGGNGRGNYATLSPIINGTTGLSNANLTQTAATEAFSTILIPTSGKWYWEQICQQTRFVGGLSSNTTVITGATTGSHVASGRYLFDVETGGAPTYSSNGGSFTTFGSTQTFSAGSVLGYAYDADNQKLWVSLNGTWLQGSPSSGTSPVMTPPSNGYFVIGSVPQTGYYDYHINFGQQPWDSRTSGPPSGFSALNTQNLPTPTIANGAQYMNAVTYAGATAPNTVVAPSAGSAANPSGATFQPDLVWIKSRSAATKHLFTDAVRGVTKRLSDGTTTDGTDAEATDTNGLTAFTASGFTVGSDTNYNNTTGPATYVAWEWNAGGSTVTGYQPSGASISCNVRANVTAGFSVVTYSYVSGTTATIGHGLGAAPSMIIIKNRTLSTENWAVYHSSLGAAYWILLSGTNASINNTTIWNNTSPTSTVFSVGNVSNTYVSGSNFVAYCFAPVAGYSAFGIYTANASATDGPFCYTGFLPRFVMIKATTNISGNWIVIDTARLTYNQNGTALYPNSSNAEVTTAYIDFLSNGFKIRNNSTNMNNTTSDTYIWAAFASNPFKTSRAF